VTLKISLVSLFPGYFKGPFDESIVKRAQQSGLVEISHTDIREFGEGKQRRVDDRAYGGGPGMVLMAEPVTKALRSVKKEDSHVVYLTPQGSLLTAKKCRELSKKPHLILLCGHYEGIDERVLEKEVDEEISIGDFVLTNGCLAAIVVVDAVIRFIPGVIGNSESAELDSFENGIFDCPHYTRPEVFEGEAVPSVLLSGHHKKIREWRHEKAREKTVRVRKDLLQGA
jgi:tRNA (guanine37-N1)-methyltransferase